MTTVVALVTIVMGLSFGQDSTICGNINSYGWTLDDIIDAVIKDADTNNDSHIDLGEARDEILGRWSSNGKNVSRDDFVAQFVVKYWDDYRLTAQFFDNMDINKDGYLSESDFFFIVLQWIDPSLNDRVPISKIRAFIHQMHPEGCKTP